jgi:peptidoglycan hydrolase-like protein with peptidoglycan-binding domain
MSGQQDIRQVQEALKNQGQNPGPIDGIMGPQTRQALRAFQSKNGLKQTGTLDAETTEKLNIDSASSGSSARPATGSGRGDSSTKQKGSSSPMGK